MTVKLLLTTPNEAKELVLKPYKIKYKNDKNEKIYVAFLENTISDAQNGFTDIYLILNETNDIVGVLALSAASIKFEELNEEDRNNWSLYEDLTEYPAIRLDLFLILPPYRGKGLGSKALDEVIAYLDAKRYSLIGYRYFITLSTNEIFDLILLSKGFKPIPTDINTVEEIRQNGFYRNTTQDTVKILRKELKKIGIWFYLDFGRL
jgi:GNAT superfamily N-acetyltransferase